MAERREGVLERIALILQCFEDTGTSALSASAIASRTGLAISTVHRLLAGLLDAGLLTRTDDHEYVIGLRMWRLGELAPALALLREGALPVMLRMFAATGQNVHLAALDGDSPSASHALFLARVHGDDSYPTKARTGGRFPLSLTGVGVALLSTKDDEWVGAYRDAAVASHHRHLRLDVIRARSRGYSVVLGEITPGGMSIAAPIPVPDAYPPAAVGVVTPAGHFDEHWIAGLVVRAAHAISSELFTSGAGEPGGSRGFVD